MRGCGRQALDGEDPFAGDRANVDLARALRRAVDVDGAGAAKTGAAAIFGPRQADVIADGPQEWCARVGVDRDLSIVQGERNHISSPLGACRHVDAALSWPRQTCGRLA